MPVCYRHPDRETYVSCTRCGRPICPDDMVPASVGFHCPDDARAGARSVRQARTVYGGAPVARPAVTSTLVGVNVVVFLATALGGTSLGFGGGASPLYTRLALQPVARDTVAGGVVPGVADGELWRLVTAMFLHFGLLHLFFNMLALLAVGPALETALGHVRFLALYALSGLAGTTASYALGPVAQQAAGASGAVFGLFAAAYLFARRRGDTATASSYAVLLAVNLVLTFVLPNIDVRGHLGGLAGGAVVAAVLALAPRGPRRAPAQALGCAGLAVALAAVVALRTAALS